MASTPPSKTHEIAAVLRDEILTGRYRPGDRLPSERDLKERFETSRGTIREALKRLEQLGIATIRPGGARVVAVEECTLDVLGPLLDLGDFPDPKLVDEALEAGSVLVGIAVRKALERNPEATIRAAREITAEMLAADPAEIQSLRGPPRLIRLFSQAGDHLVLRLIMNGLREQAVERMHAVGFPPRQDPGAIRSLAAELDDALAAADADRAANAMCGFIDLIRAAASELYRTLQARNELEIAHS